jgi:hypothetical protein
VKVGDCFISNEDPYHLLVVAARCRHGNILLATVTSPGRGKEETCWVFQADHPHLKYDSLINYAKGTYTGLPALLVDAAFSGQVRGTSPVAASVTQRICAGLPRSRAPLAIKRFLTERCCPEPAGT